LTISQAHSFEKIQFEKGNGSTILNYSLEIEAHNKNPENGHGK
jgi:hypothetical protein